MKWMAREHIVFGQPVERPLIVKYWLTSALGSQEVAVCSPGLIRHRLDTGQYPDFVSTPAPPSSITKSSQINIAS